MTAAALAARVGVSPDAVRYYQWLGPPPAWSILADYASPTAGSVWWHMAANRRGLGFCNTLVSVLR